MGDWIIVAPEATVNLFADPSFRFVSPTYRWTLSVDVGGCTPQRTDTEQWAGPTCMVFDFVGCNWAQVAQALTCTATSYTLTARIRRSAGGTLTDAQAIPYFNTATSTWDEIKALGNGWYLCSKTGTATAGSRSFGVRALEDHLQIDGLQLENKAYYTTYCDGDQPGCYWKGGRWESQSSREALSREGGRPIDLEDDLGLKAELFGGIGVPSLVVLSTERASSHGAKYNRSRGLASPLTLSLWAKGTDQASLHSARQALIEIITPDLTEPQQPFWLEYWGATLPKRVRVVYEGGLEFGTQQGYQETLPLRLLALDPFWQGLGAEAEGIPSLNQAQTLRLIFGYRERAWTTLSPAVGGTYNTIRSLAFAKDRDLVVGGDFQNFDNQANCDYIARWDARLEAWGPMGTGATAGLTRDVLALAVAANGDIWAGGAFTTMGGVANTNYIAVWDESASVWTSVGNANNTVWAILCASDGTVYAGGSFTTIGGVGCTYIAQWDGAAWNSLGTLNGAVYALAEGPDGTIYVGGAFTTIGGVGYNRVAQWDGSAWDNVGLGFTSQVQALLMAPNGELYAGGQFVYADGDQVNYVARYNGANWGPMGSGMDAQVECLAWYRGWLYAGGSFDYAGGRLAAAMARWNGTTWAHVPVECGTLWTVYDIVADGQQIFFGCDINASETFPVELVLTNGGTARARPLIELEWRQGGTQVDIREIKHKETGWGIQCDYAMQMGERLSIDLEQGTVTSDFRGSILAQIFDLSDLQSFALLPGTNTLQILCLTAGSPTVDAYCSWIPL